MHTRIAAIAKDEGAYLADWIYHHLYFGFDSIEVYVNRTSDDSIELLKQLNIENRINIILADDIVESAGENFQNQAYSNAYTKAKNDGVDYLLYLDIDEFWTPRDFSTNIQSYLKNIGLPDVVSFEWVFPNDDSELFGRPFGLHNYVSKDHHVKTIFKVDQDVEAIHVHNVQTKNAVYKLADGTIFEGDDPKNKYRVNHDESKGDLRPAFILHRVTRSQVEYVSILGKGRPSSSSKIKDNRWGYVSSQDVRWGIDIDLSILNKYEEGFIEFLNVTGSTGIIEKSRAFVIERYKKFLDIVVGCDTDDFAKVNRLCKDVHLVSILAALNTNKIMRSGVELDIAGLEVADYLRLFRDIGDLASLNVEEMLIQAYLIKSIKVDGVQKSINRLLEIDLGGYLCE